MIRMFAVGARSERVGRRSSPNGLPVERSVGIVEPDRTGIRSWARGWRFRAALALVISFTGANEQRVSALREQIADQGRPDDIPANEIVFIHDRDFVIIYGRDSESACRRESNREA